MRSSNTSLSRSFALGIAIVCLAGRVRALDPERALGQYVRDYWGPERGFPGGPVHAITQTGDGYLWIGAESGLVRFDGVAFTLVPDRGPDAFVIDHVFGLTTDREGSLWIRVSDPTLLRYRNGIFMSVAWDPKPGVLRVTAIARATTGALLVASRRNGAISWTGSKFQTLAAAASLPLSPVISIAGIKEDDVWLGTREAGLVRVRGHQVTQITRDLPDLRINCLLLNENGEMLVGTERGMVRWDGSKITTAGVPRALDHAQILAMIRDRDSNIWIATGKQGLLRLNGQGLFSLSKPGASAPITALFEDREGDLWTGSATGIERLRDSAFVTYSSAEGLPKENSGPVYVDTPNGGAHGRVWWAPATGGLFRLDEGKIEHVKAAHLDQDVVYSIAGSSTSVWLGRQRGGLTHLALRGNTVAATTYTEADGLAQNSVVAVQENRDRSVWAGTLTAGVSHFKDGQFTGYTKANGLAANSVTSIAEGADGTMWFGTTNGLSRFRANAWTTFGIRDGLPSENVYSLFVDSSGIVWIGTLRGIAFIRSGHLVIPASLPLFLREQIFGVAEDRSGLLWISTSHRVLRVSRDKMLSGPLIEGDVREYGLADGLREARGVRRDRSVITDSFGRIWFSRREGLSMIDPERTRTASVPAIVHIAGFSVDGGTINLRNPIRVPPNPKRIAIDYAGLDLCVPDGVRFRFMLDGFDHAWSQPVSAKEAVYTNLGPGSYRFHVTASNADGAWNGREAILLFGVDPALWQTWWFRLGGILTLALGVAAIYRYRLHQMAVQINLRFAERLGERTRLARDLHDTLLQTIQGSKMAADDALDVDGAGHDSIRMRTALERISVWLGQATQEGRAALNSLRSSTSQMNDLAEAFHRAAEDCMVRGAMKVDLYVEGMATDMHPIVRDEIFHIGYEAIRNACGHSGGSLLEVELSYANDLTLRVRDNGKGLDPEIAAKGREGHFGLRGMQERAERIGGKLRLFSSAGSGTEMELIVPGNIVFQAMPKGILTSLGRLFRNGKPWPTD